jgi:hypothetical protein
MLKIQSRHLVIVLFFMPASAWAGPLSDWVVNNVKESSQKYYAETIQPKIDESPLLSAASKAALSAKDDLTAKVTRDLETLTDSRNNDIRATYSQNKVPLPTSLRGD